MKDWKVGDILEFQDSYKDLCEYRGNRTFVWLTFDGEPETPVNYSSPQYIEQPQCFRKLTKLELALR